MLNEEHQKLQKETTKMLVEKGAHHDELIAALMVSKMVNTLFTRICDFKHHFSQREQERLKKTVEKKDSQIAEHSQSRHEKVQQDNEVVATLTQLCKEREDKVAQLERELKALATSLAESPARQHTGSADKATITGELSNDVSPRVSTPSTDYPQNDHETVVSSTQVDAQPRRRRIVRSSGKNSSASTLPPTQPRSGSGRRKSSGLSRFGLLYVIIATSVPPAFLSISRHIPHQVTILSSLGLIHFKFFSFQRWST